MKIAQIALTITLLFLSFSAFAERQTILVIESYHNQHPWDASYLEALRENLQDYELVTFEMDTKRLPASDYQQQADKAWQLYLSVAPDLVILGDDNAVKYMVPRLQHTETPVVFLGVNVNPRATGLADIRNVTGILERPLFQRSITEANRLFNYQLKKILILFDDSHTSGIAINEFTGGAASMDFAELQVDFRLSNQLEEWHNAVKNAEHHGYDAIIIGLYHTVFDGENRHVDSEHIIRWINKNSTIPVFSFWDFSVGHDKAIGGVVLVGKKQGEEAAALVKHILQRQPDNLPGIKTAERGQYRYSKSQLKRWQIDENESLRSGSVLVD